MAKFGLHGGNLEIDKQNEEWINKCIIYTGYSSIDRV